jgi:hypothetical protein
MKRSGNNALGTWATASEMSNSGFKVQVLPDGVNFRKLAFVTSQAINSNATLNYSYLDEEKGKVGTRYYCLRQLDQDGSSDFSPVRAIAFSGGSQMVAFSAHPNPYNANDAVKLSLGTSSCQATLRCAHSGQNVLVARLYEQRVNGWPLVSDPECARWLQLPVARRRN